VELILVFFLLAKSAIAASFLIIYPFAGELFPTQLRGLGIGVSAYIGGLGRIIIPFITFLVSFAPTSSSAVRIHVFVF
jgi:OCT family organic cation transporter-like MFS transporter 4/5